MHSKFQLNPWIRARHQKRFWLECRPTVVRPPSSQNVCFAFCLFSAMAKDARNERLVYESVVCSLALCVPRFLCVCACVRARKRTTNSLASGKVIDFRCFPALSCSLLHAHEETQETNAKHTTRFVECARRSISWKFKFAESQIRAWRTVVRRRAFVGGARMIVR